MMNLGKETETLEFKKSTGELKEAMVSISSIREELAANIIKTTRTVQRALDSLKEKGYIRRIGSRQKPRWEILK